jgi:hypothetical protein
MAAANTAMRFMEVLDFEFGLCNQRKFFPLMRYTDKLCRDTI